MPGNCCLLPVSFGRKGSGETLVARPINPPPSSIKKKTLRTFRATQAYKREIKKTRDAIKNPTNGEKMPEWLSEIAALLPEVRPRVFA